MLQIKYIIIYVQHVIAVALIECLFNVIWSDPLIFIFLLLWNGVKLGKGFGTCYVNTHTHTHTHTHVVFYGLRGLSIGVMVFILYKLYVLLPYTYPTPKLSPHRRWCITIFPQKNSLCTIYKRFKLWGH